MPLSRASTRGSYSRIEGVTNLLSVRQLALMGFATFFDIDTMDLLWIKTLKVAFVGHVENGLYVINFLERPTKTATCLMAI